MVRRRGCVGQGGGVAAEPLVAGRLGRARPHIALALGEGLGRWAGRVARRRDGAGRRGTRRRRRGTDRAGVAAAWRLRPTPRGERRRRNKGGLQAFSRSFSKSRAVFSKLFQRKLWRFCGISRGYKDPQTEKTPFQISSRCSPPFGRILDATCRIPRAFTSVKWRAFVVSSDPVTENF